MYVAPDIAGRRLPMTPSSHRFRTAAEQEEPVSHTPPGVPPTPPTAARRPPRGREDDRTVDSPTSGLRSITKRQWTTLTGTTLGWGMEGFDIALFTLVVGPAV